MIPLYNPNIFHSAKGSTWEEHKYVKRVNGTYYYPVGYTKGRTIDSLDDTTSTEGDGVDYRSEDIENLAREVIRGNFANGEERKQLLGEYYQQVQSRVNEILKSGGSTKISDTTSSTVENGQRVVDIVNEKIAARLNKSTSTGPDLNAVYNVYNKKHKQKKTNQ